VTLAGSGANKPVPEPPAPPPTPTPPAPPVTPPAPKFVSVTSTLASSARVSKSRKVELGSLVCGTAVTCTTKLTATMTVGEKTYRVTATVKAKTGKKVTLVMTLPSSVYKALESTKSKTAKVKVTSSATDTGGGKSTRTKTMTIKA
jgi:hypothetical protein